jgi:hypothetical protein
MLVLLLGVTTEVKDVTQTGDTEVQVFQDFILVAPRVLCGFSLVRGHESKVRNGQKVR